METKNKVAAITGAARGIGKGIALDLAKQGYSLVISDLKLEDCQLVVEEVEKIGVKAVAVVCDVSNRDQVDELVKTALDNFSQLDVLVHNAGIFPFQSFMEMKEEDWDRVMDVNLKSAFFCSQAAAKVMQPGSKIIHIASIAASVAFSGLTHYCASKAGMLGLVRALALELAEKKINVNAVCPGAIETPGATGSLDEKGRQQFIASIPWGRMGQSQDIAAAVSFLASEGADYITGQSLTVDGGYTLR
jgi:NAD(P)-dependent dehydrogenase (short-subunit alcohol dehydrogenase family)